MSDEYNRGYNAARYQEAVGQLFSSIAKSNDDDAWQRALDNEHARAVRAERALTKANAWITELEDEVVALRVHISEMEELRAQSVKATQNLIAASQTTSQMLEGVEEERRLAENLVQSTRELIAAREKEQRCARALIEELQESVQHHAESAKEWKEVAKTYDDEYGNLIEIVRTSGAMTAGFEAIYKMLVVEVIQKHDAATFTSLDPNKRISIMDEAWLDFIQTDQYEHSPDLAFSYAIPQALSRAETNEDPIVRGAADIDQEPEGQ